VLLWLGVLNLRDGVRDFARDEGQGLVEYAVIIALIALGAMVALSFLAGGVGNVFEMVTDNLEAIATNTDPIEVARRHGHGWCRHHGGC
jgi:pilus assembly protein Flp/PilA